MASGPINKLPSGLLSLFDLKTGGRYPGLLGDTLTPVLELLNWYADTNIESAGVVNAALAANQNAQNIAPGAFLTVPNTEFWYVRRCFAQAEFSAAAASTLMGLSLVIIPPGPAPQPITLPTLGTTGPFTSNAAVINRTLVTMPEQFIATPGSAISAAHGGFIFGAATCTISINANFVRLRA